MRIITKGLDYTMILYSSKNSIQETVMLWRLKKERKLSECGVWIDGKKETQT